jgi:fucose permease
VNWSLVLAAFGSLFVIGMLDNARGPLFPEVLAGLALTDAEGAWLFASASAAGGVGSWAARFVLARVRASRALWLGLVLGAVGVGLLGRSRSLGELVLGSTLFGLSFGSLSLVQGALVQRGAPPALQRQAFAGLHAMYGAASLLAPLLVTFAARSGVDWRGAFGLFACAPLLVLALTLPLRDPPPAPVDPAAPDAPAPGPRALAVSLMTGLYVAAELALSTRLVLHLRRLEWPPEAASLALAAFFACLLVGRALLGLVRVPASHRQLLAASAGGSLLLIAGGLSVHPALLCAAGFTLAPFFPVASALVADEFPGAFDRVMSTLMATVCVVVMVAHQAVGALSDAVGLHAALWLAPACLLGALGLVVATAPRRARAG